MIRNKSGLILSITLVVVAVFSILIVDTQETEADNYALNVSRQPDGFARVPMRLSEYRKMTPGPVELFIFHDHPTRYDRVYMSMLWKSENMDESED